MLTVIFISLAGLSIAGITALGRKLLSMRRERRQATAQALCFEAEQCLRYPPDYERARIAYEQVLVFDNTLADAHYRLGSFHHQGAGTAINLEKARCFYEKALSLGKSEALLALGAIQEKASPYRYAEQAFATYLHAARYPNLRIKACEALERILLTYPRPTGEEAYQLSKHFLDQQDIEKAVFWYIKGENQPIAHATHPLKTHCINTPNFCFSLGQAYEVQDNLGAASSAYAKARHCTASFDRLKTMADDGLAVAQYALGHDYYHHQGNNRNAIDYCLKAAAQHYVPALDYLNQTSLSAESYYTIASAYETGNIVKKDITQALSFYKKARNQGAIGKRCLPLADAMKTRLITP